MDIFNNAKKLGFGMMRLPITTPGDAKSIDTELLCKMVDYYLEQGFTYFDTAWLYHSFMSECAAKDALVSRHPRESFTLATKLHGGFVHNKDDRDIVFNEQLRKTGVEYFDYYLLHDIGEDFYKKYTELDCFEWLKEKKAQGLVKHMGFSFHDGAELLDKVLTEHPEMEFVQLQLNYLDWESAGVQSRKCYEVAVKHGKPVIVMEPVKGGTLANVPEEAEKLFKDHAPDMSVPSWAIRFAASHENVKMVLSGMSNMEQVLDNTGFMADFKPLTPDEKKMVLFAGQVIRKEMKIACTGCAYCLDQCPRKIAIPQYFKLYTENGESDQYADLTKEFGKASDCIVCGACEKICPQHLPVRKYLRDVAEKYE